MDSCRLCADASPSSFIMTSYTPLSVFVSTDTVVLLVTCVRMVCRMFTSRNWCCVLFAVMWTVVFNNLHSVYLFLFHLKQTIIRGNGRVYLTMSRVCLRCDDKALYICMFVSVWTQLTQLNEKLIIMGLNFEVLSSWHDGWHCDRISFCHCTALVILNTDSSYVLVLKAKKSYTRHSAVTDRCTSDISEPAKFCHL